MHIVMLAAENGGLPGGKAGGLGDVIRELPRALADCGHSVTVLSPGYGMLSQLPGASVEGPLEAEFCGAKEALTLYRVPAQPPVPGIEYLVL
jgi:starch synthase